jgi:localization factor PodJL
MSIGGPWSVKGIDPRARARAKTAARRQGVTLGEWLNRAILEDSDPANPQWDDALSAFPGFAGDAVSNEEEDRLLRSMVNRLGERVESAEDLSSKALVDLDMAVQKLAERISASEQDTATDRVETREGIDRVRQDHDSLSGRIQSLEAKGPSSGNGETFSAETAKAVETTLAKLARRLYEHEHDVAARLHDAEIGAREFGEQTRKTTGSLENRIERMEDRASDFGELSKRRDQRTTEAMSGLQSVTETLKDRVEKADRSAADAARAVETSVTLLDGRLHALETRNAGDNVDLERRLDRLTDEVATAITDTRAQIAEARSDASSQPRVDRLEAALTQALQRADETDRRQGENLSRLGDQITQLATAMDKRVTESELRTLEAAKATRAEEQLEQRLDTTRKENKRAMLRMGEEVSRLGRALAERIAKSEARSSQVVSAATDKMAEVVERLESSRGAREEDLDERLLKSEARTAERIEKAMTGVQERLSSMRDDAEEAMTPVERAMTALADRLEVIENSTAKPDAPETAEKTDPSINGAPQFDAEADRAPVIDFDTPLGPPPQAETPMGVDGDVETDPFLIQNRVAPTIPDADTPAVALEAPVLRARAESVPTRTSEPQARPEIAATAPRASAREKMAQVETQAEPQINPDMIRTRTPARPGVRHDPVRKQAPTVRPVGATADAEFLATARERTRISDSIDFDETGRSGGKARWLIGTSIIGATIALVVLVYSVVNYSGAFGGDSLAASPSNNTNLVAQLEADLAAGTTTTSSEPARAEETTTPATPANTFTETDAAADTRDPIANDEPASPAANLVADAGNNIIPEASPVVESTALPVRDSAPRTLEAAASDGDPIARYQLGLQRLTLGDAVGGTILLRRAAEQGIPAAQYRYAKQLTSGQGVEINLEAARRWTERAANSGHRMAMQELAIMYLYGTGVAQDGAMAARWFEEAALLGLSDSQFNLAVLFSQGNGVEQSLPDAYAWFSIVAAGGDAIAAQRAAELVDQMPAEAVAQAQAIATDFRPHTMSDDANGIYPDQPWNIDAVAISPSIQRAQGFLSVLGYSPGPIDGMMGERTRQAIMNFQSDHELLPTGRVDPALLERLQLASSN